MITGWVDRLRGRNLYWATGVILGSTRPHRSGNCIACPEMVHVSSDGGAKRQSAITDVHGSSLECCKACSKV